MTKFKLTLLLATIAASLVVTLFLFRTAQVKLRENDKTVLWQDEQVAGLMAEQERMSNQWVAAGSATRNQESELARLRRLAQALQVQTNELANNLARQRPMQVSPTAAKREPRPPEYYDELHRRAGGKTRDAVNLSQVFTRYASDHQGRFPSSLDQTTTYLQRDNLPLSGTNQFEILYHGSIDDLKGIPGGAVALFRDRQTWLAPSGKPARVYGLANGSSQIVESDDDFKTWEAEHVFSSSAASQ